ncbi:MAG: hypothetical protein ICV72_04930 [Aldersonia sp.]|jgi:hypothetical protein|nr:hypothetical protein [Aldersonia sp.]
MIVLAMWWWPDWVTVALFAARFVHLFVVATLLVVLYRWLHRADERDSSGGSGAR